MNSRLYYKLYRSTLSRSNRIVILHDFINIWSFLAVFCPAYSIVTRPLQVYIKNTAYFQGCCHKKIRILNSCCEVGAFANSLQSSENGT